LPKKWGADQTIDYAKENVLQSGKKFDVIFDLSGKMPFEKAKKILKKNKDGLAHIRWAL
jgi:NADPH:quinone reductase-like Zn-dependent oxidoreductase